MDSVILDHLEDEDRKNYSLLYDIITYTTNGVNHLNIGHIVYIRDEFNHIINEHIVDKLHNESITLKIIPTMLTIIDSMNNYLLTFSKGELHYYQKGPLSIKWRNNRQIEYIVYYENNEDKLINICDLEGADREAIDHYCKSFNIRLNYYRLTEFEYLQSLRHERNFIIYRDKENKLNLLQSNLMKNTKDLIDRVNLLKENPFDQHIKF